MSEENPYQSGRMDALNDDVITTRLANSLKVSQIIAGALVMGVVFFLAIVLVIIRGDLAGLPNAGILTTIATGFGVLMIVNHMILPSIVVRQMIGKAMEQTTSSDARIDRLGDAFRTQLIISIALLEGAAMFSLVTLIVEKNVAAMGMSILLIILMIVRFPTQTKLLWWVQDKLSQAN